MENDPLKDAHKLFTETGYKGDIEAFKNLMSSNEDALKDAHKLFVDTGYKGDQQKFSDLLGISKKEQVDSMASPLDSASNNSDSVIPFIQEDQISDSQSVEITERVFDGDIAILYDQYKEAGVISPQQEKVIQNKVKDQKEGNRSFWEKAEAFTEGMIRTGYAIPLYKYDDLEDLKSKQEVKNRTNFLESLPDEKRKELNDYAVNRTYKLEDKNLNIIAENTIMEEKAKSLINEIEQGRSAIEQLRGENKELPEEGRAILENSIKELQNINSRYNSNIDLLESNQEDIGNFVEELDLLKRNYRGLSYYKDLARLSSADMLSGLMETGVSIKDMAGDFRNNSKEDLEEFNREFREEIQRQRGFLKPSMSVEDISDARGFGNWLAEQTATQLPTLTVLAASGGTAGLTVMGTSSAGQKIGALKDERLGAKKILEDSELSLLDTNLTDSDRKSLEKKVRKIKNSAEMTDADIYLTGAAVGAFEALTERVTLGILSKGKRALTAAKKTGLDIDFKLGIKDYVANATKNSLSEGGSEFINQLAQNSVDIMYLGKEDVHIFDGAIDALASGTALGMGMSATPTLIGLGAKALMNKTTSNKISEDSNKIESLVNELENNKETLSEASQKLIQDKINKLSKETKQTLQDSFDNVSDLPKEEIQELIDIDKKANGIISKVKDINKSELSSEIKQELLQELKKESSVLTDRKSKILSVKDGDKGETIVQKEGVKKGIHPEGSETSAEVEGGERSGEIQSETISESGVGANGEGVQQSSDGDKAEVEGKSPQAETIDKALLESLIIKELSKVDLSESTGLNSMISKLDKWDKDLGSFSKDTLGVNIPVVVAQGVVKTMKVAMKTAKTGADVISQGINHLKSTDWYKELSSTEKFEAERDIIENINNIGEPKDIKEEKPFDFKKEISKIASGVPILSYLDDKYANKWADKLDTWSANKVSESLASTNNVKRFLAQSATNWYNGLPRTEKQLAERRKVTGKQELAFVQGSKMTKELQTLINFDPKSAERVHSAMDPELYEEGDRIDYASLTDNEKILFGELRYINNKTHETNYELGFINEETYEKFKGSYIGRGYEIHEGLQEDIEKGLFAGSKIYDKFLKERKEIDQWKIDNTVKDPIYLTINRMIQTERNVAVKAYSEFVLKQDNVISNTDEKGFTQLNGKAYGALDGKYVVNYVAEDFQGYFYANKFIETVYDLAKMYDNVKARQILKRYHTVWAAPVQIGNLLSNNAFAFVSGINLISLYKQMPDSLKEMRDQSGDFLTLLENNIVGANILKGEFTFKNKKQSGLKLSNLKLTKTKLKELDEKAQKLYGASDDMMKLMAFKALKKSGFTEAEAIKKVFEGFQNYATVGKIWDLASKTPLVGNVFIKFKADLQRIVKNAVVRRPLTTATFLGGLKLMTYLSSKFLAGEEEEVKNIRESRPFIPKIGLGFDDIPLVYKIGGDKEINVARFISPLYEYDVPNKDWLEKLSSFTPLQWGGGEAKEMGQSTGGFDTPDVLLGSVWAAFISNRDFRGKSISDPYATRYKESGLSETEKFVNRIEYVSRSVVPLFSTLQDVYLSNKTGEDYFGRDKTILDITISKFMKIQTFDDKSLQKVILSRAKSINYNSKGINSKIDAIKGKYKNDVSTLNRRKEEGKISQEKFDRAVKNITEDSMKRINKQLGLLVKQQEDLNKLVKDVNGMK